MTFDFSCIYLFQYSSSALADASTVVPWIAPFDFFLFYVRCTERSRLDVATHSDLWFNCKDSQVRRRCV